MDVLTTAEAHPSIRVRIDRLSKWFWCHFGVCALLGSLKVQALSALEIWRLGEQLDQLLPCFKQILGSSQ